MSLILKCANSECKNLLTEYEMNRINPSRWSDKRLCRRCRVNSIRINTIDCVTCGNRINNHDRKIYCTSCYKKRHREAERKKRTRKLFMMDEIWILLTTNDVMTIPEISQRTGMPHGSIRQTMYNLQHKHGCNIVRGYKIDS